MSLVAQVATLTTRIGTEFKSVRAVEGLLASLTTTDKTNLVAAINEVKAALGSGVPDASTTVKGIVELATTAEATTGTDTVRAVTPAGLQAGLDALIAAAPGTLNTLDEIAAALGDDPNFAATLVTTLSGKQASDLDLSAIAALTSAADKLPYATGTNTWAMTDFTAAGRALVDDADATAQRATLSVYSQAQIGDPATDFVATFEAALL